MTFFHRPTSACLCSASCILQAEYPIVMTLVAQPGPAYGLIEERDQFVGRLLVAGFSGMAVRTVLAAGKTEQIRRAVVSQSVVEGEYGDILERVILKPALR